MNCSDSNQIPSGDRNLEALKMIVTHRRKTLIHWSASKLKVNGSVLHHHFNVNVVITMYHCGISGAL